MRRGRLRIIGGRWRGRLLPVAAAEGLRPTADRVRETLFNWLQPELAGARCLDLFAGSGALGLEALSRGAESVVFVDRSAVVMRTLAANLVNLGAGERARTVVEDAQRFLGSVAQPFDLVFLDPPFQSTIIQTVCCELEARGWLAPRAAIYIEVDRHSGLPPLPHAWELVHQRRAGRVAFGLARRARESSAGPKPIDKD